MNKLAALHQFLLALNLFAAEQLDSFADEIKIQPAGYPDSNGRLVVCVTDYTAAFNVERFPHGHISTDALIAQLVAWLLQNDPERADYSIDMTAEVLDIHTANLEWRIAFRETVTAVEDPIGAIELDGKRYSL